MIIFNFCFPRKLSLFSFYKESKHVVVETFYFNDLHIKTHALEFISVCGC